MEFYTAIALCAAVSCIGLLPAVALSRQAEERGTSSWLHVLLSGLLSGTTSGPAQYLWRLSEQQEGGELPRILFWPFAVLFLAVALHALLWVKGAFQKILALALVALMFKVSLAVFIEMYG